MSAYKADPGFESLPLRQLVFWGNLKGHASRFSFQIFFTFAYEARRPKAGFFSSLTCKNLLAFIIFVSIIMKEENINNFMISKYGK